MTNKFLSQLTSSKGLQTRTGATITLTTLVAIYSLAMVISLPGLAVSPILSELQKVFPNVSEFELQMLESLPSLVIIPFILLSGHLSVYISIRKLVIAGLAIFATSSIIYLMPINIGLMLFNSALLGVGAGMIIPFSTGLVAHYFAGARRTQQLGNISAIANLTLVIATAAAGYLADIEWHLSFLVYSISIVSLVLASRMAKIKETDQEEKVANTKNKELVGNGYSWAYIKKDWPISLMVFYFIITTVVLAIPMNLSLFMEHYKIGSVALSGTLMSLFFLSITLPGFFINRLVSQIKDRNNLIWIGIIILGVVCVMLHMVWSVTVGIILIGLGYGVMQPLIYDRTAEGTAISRVTLHLSLVMSMNYFAIILYPFIQRLVQYITASNVMTSMFMSLTLGLGYWIYYFWRVSRKTTSN